MAKEVVFHPAARACAAWPSGVILRERHGEPCESLAKTEGKSIMLSRRLVLAGAFASTLLPGLAMAEGPGRYTISGIDPRTRESYSGTAQLTKTGDDTWRIVWRIGGQTWNGHGIGDGKVMAVNYSGQGASGVFLMIAKSGGGYEAVWSYTGDTKLGSEDWKKAN